jgi:hypothetical protein
MKRLILAGPLAVISVIGIAILIFIFVVPAILVLLIIAVVSAAVMLAFKKFRRKKEAEGIIDIKYSVKKE